jgi:hypothetical protein
LRIESPRTNAPITIARSGSVRSSFVPRGNSLETNGSAALQTPGRPEAACANLALADGRVPLRPPAGPPAHARMTGLA